MSYKVYEILFPNGKRYFGKTRQSLKNRLSQHKYSLHNIYMREAIINYGLKNAYVGVVKDGLTSDEANDLEHRLILKYETYKRENGYNILKGGEKKYMKEAKNNVVFEVSMEHDLFECLDKCCLITSEMNNKNVSKSELISALVVDYFRSIINTLKDNKKDDSATSKTQINKGEN